MSGPVFTLRTPPPAQALDVARLTPERLSGLDLREIERLAIPCGNRALAVSDVFAVAGGSGDTVVIRPEGARLLHAGAAMTAGRLVIEGEGGMHAGRAMAGGELTITGGAAEGAGAAMRGGVLTIAGSAGDGLGGGLPGEPMGMTGGLIVVRGAAGARAGERMRRGTVLVEGDAGDFAAARMLAGTLIVLGALGRYPGFQMRRGSILAGGGVAEFLPGFADHGVHELGVLRLLEAWLRAYTSRLAGRFAAVHRLSGDSAAHGTGELLLAAG